LINKGIGLSGTYFLKNMIFEMDHIKQFQNFIDLFGNDWHR